MPCDLTDDKSTLVQVMAWCHPATSHNLNQCWLRSPQPYVVTRPQWVNIISRIRFCFFCQVSCSWKHLTPGRVHTRIHNWFTATWCENYFSGNLYQIARDYNSSTTVKAYAYFIDRPSLDIHKYPKDPGKMIYCCPTWPNPMGNYLTTGFKQAQ